ncbi:Hypothetical predicted protein [Paramuricea clavata]|uniref:Uncharacterized protein n=1 Tax=Paramuricea clavata TaxID=317549 RepID=A0A7D9JF68_PARCT|nr:Hypothetical predicted protein [Paramuricea clavata]
MDDYLKNSSVFKETIAGAVVVAVEETVKPLHTEIASLKDEVTHLKAKLANVEVKANDNEQYSRRNNIRIFGLAEEIKEDCYDKVLKLCENHLNIEVSRDEIDRAHRVGQLKQVSSGQPKPAPRAMIVKLICYTTKMKFMKARRNLRGRQIYINEDLTKSNHQLLLYTKANCSSDVKIYSVDGTVVARTDRRVYRIKHKEDLVKYGLLYSKDSKVIEVNEDADSSKR